MTDAKRASSVGAAAKRALPFDGRARLAFVLFGGIVALQSSPSLDATKLGYLVGTSVCLLGASAAVWSARSSPEVRLAAPWIAASAALAVLLAMSFFVARANGTPVDDWFRDVAAYGLFAAMPIIALDARASAPRKLVIGMLVLAGLLGGLSWAIEWLSRRHILEFPIARLVFPSGQLPGMLYLFAMAAALTERRRQAAWAVLAGVILGFFLLTGTRSSLLLLIGPVVMAALAGRTRLRPFVRSFVSHAVVAAAMVLGFQLALTPPTFLGVGQSVTRPGSSAEPGSSGSVATGRPNVVGERIGSLPTLAANLALDPSIKERRAQYEAAWALFVSSPILGVGPGHSIDWVDVSGYPRAGFTADTPLVLPAKFGLVGVLAFLGVMLAYASTVRIALRRGRQSAATLALVGYGVLTVAGLPLGFPIEDKGASLALMLLLALAFLQSEAPNAIEPAGSGGVASVGGESGAPDQ